MLEDRGSATLEAGDEAEDPAVDQRRDPTNRGGGDRGGNRAFPPRVNGSFFPLSISSNRDRFRSELCHL